MIRPLCTYLAGQGCGTIGTTLFAGAFPNTATFGLAVCETGPEIPRLTPAGVLSIAKSVQLLSRGRTYETARQTARAAYDALVGKSNLSLEGWQIACIDGIAPQYLGTDDKLNHTFSANLTVYGKETG